eukprot:g9797.t1
MSTEHVSFFSRLTKRCNEVNSLLCVGLDPHRVDLEKIGDVTANGALTFCKNIVDQTKHIAVSYKPNAAFFEAFGGSGVNALEKLIQYIPNDIPVLLDIKRGDIGSTAAAYADAAYESLKADAVTLSPYMGSESIRPFIKDASKGAFVICKTSNPSSKDLQECILSNGSALFECVATLCETWNAKDNLGVVVGATDVNALTRVRAAAPGIWILAPGIGAQGGNLVEAVTAGLRKSDGMGLIVPVSRGISRAENPKEAAENLNKEINDAREKSLALMNNGNKTTTNSLEKHQIDFIKFALKCNVLKFGEFTLKSGRKSPYFFNAGLFDSGLALKRIGEYYAKVIVDSGVKFDVLFGPAYKGITLASAVSIALCDYGMDVPYAYNRKEKKDHGEGGKLVGAPIKGKNVLIIDDVITAGTAIREAMTMLNAGGGTACGVIIALDRQEKVSDTSTKSAIQTVQTEYSIPVLNVVRLDDLLSFAKSSDEMSSFLPSIEAYRLKYGVEY